MVLLMVPDQVVVQSGCLSLYLQMYSQHVMVSSAVLIRFRSEPVPLASMTSNCCTATPPLGTGAAHVVARIAVCDHGCCFSRIWDRLACCLIFSLYALYAFRGYSSDSWLD